MKKICLINCYFGKLPNYFQFWLNSCKYNRTIDFIVFTDDPKQYDIPENVKIIYIKFEDLIKKFQSKFDFKIYLDKPYKLCDFKPTYGVVFEEYLEEYDFWGHCDLDVVWGDIRKYIPENVLEKHDKIYKYGHFSIYKNKTTINNNFKELKINSKPIYREILSSSKSYFFDETAGIIKLYDNKKYFIYNNPKIIADISIKYNNLVPVSWKEKGKFVFQWKIENNTSKIFGKFLENGKIREEEFMYIHLQKRKMNVEIDNESNFFIVPNKFINLTNFNKKIFNDVNNNITIFRKEYIKYRYKNLINKIRKDKNE